MTQEGQIVLFRFPQTDQTEGKLRPALALRRAPGRFGDWLVCMISSQLSQAISGFDELMLPADPDFSWSGLKRPSVIRISRLAVIGESALLGQIGNIGPERLARIRSKVSDWIRGA